MAMGLNAQYTVVVSSSSANFNAAADTVLAEKFLPAGGVIRRIGYVGFSSTTPGTAFRIKASVSTNGGSSYTDLTNYNTAAQNPSAARGQIVFKDAPSRVAAEVSPGSNVAIRVHTQGAASATGYVFMEIEEQPFNTYNRPSNAIASA